MRQPGPSRSDAKVAKVLHYWVHQNLNFISTHNDKIETHIDKLNSDRVLIKQSPSQIYVWRIRNFLEEDRAWQIIFFLTQNSNLCVTGPCRTEFSDVGFDFIVVGTNKI